MIKALRILPMIGCGISLFFIYIAAKLFEADNIPFGQATSMLLVAGAFLLASYEGNQEVTALKRRISRQSKCAEENSQLNYTPEDVIYASSFYEGQPVVTTEEYGEGPGYHCFIEKIDHTDIGRPFKVRMCGNLGTDWVSGDEIAPDKEI